jgi:hypothetical protein
MSPATSALPLAIMIVTGLGALVVAAGAAFVALRCPLRQRREALAACFAALLVALLVAAVAQHPAFWRGLA